MRLGAFDGGRLGVIRGDEVVDVTGLVGGDPDAWPPTGMVRLIAGFDRLRPALAGDLGGLPRRALAEARLECPIAWPNKVIAFPANYRAHVEEMKTGTGLISAFKADGQGFFLKANSSLSGPGDPIVLPAVAARQIHHECEIAVIVGRGGRDIPLASALDHVFGYACLIDVVIRGKEERVMRKSYDTFCPLGPWITTADEIADPADMSMSLSVNGAIRQSANTRDLIVSIPEMIRMSSAVMTLYPGDVIASGTPAGVGPIAAGDRVDIEVRGVGAMSLAVLQGDAGAHEIWDKPYP